LKGVPVRLELGPRDLADGSVTLVRRISGTKEQVPLDKADVEVGRALNEQQDELIRQAEARRDDRITDVAALEEAAELSATGWARLPWDLVGADGEARLAEQGVTVRCLLRADGDVPDSEDEADLLALVARTY
jgi:prolyl-tRNA synthetase